MPDSYAQPVAIEVAAWKVTIAPTPPETLWSYRQHAELHEDFEEPAERDARGILFAGVSRAAEEWPSLVITQGFSPCLVGFSPGVLTVPETEVVFIGAGTRLLCYQHDSGRWTKRWQDETHLWFWGWRRYGDVVVMSAEIELAAWTIDGVKLWTTFVEPPWSYEVSDSRLRLDVMGTISSFPLETGPTRR